MNKKVSLLILSIVLAIIVFIISINIQKQAIDYVPTVNCLIVNKDIKKNNNISKDDINSVEMPVAIIANTKVAKSFEEVEKLYLKDNLYKGQIVLLDQFDTKENLMIYDQPEGFEKISIKVKSSEYAVSYILKEDSIVNLYATVSNEYASSELFKDNDKKVVGDENNGYTVIKLLEGTKVLATFDENGEEVKDLNEKNIDTILISVSNEDAQKINLLREIATFNITEK